VDFTLEPEVADEALDAVRISAARLGVSVTPGAPRRDCAWWRAGVEEAVEQAPLEVVAPRYDAARSPRSTRGATRA
jgi:hypothetical protein